MKKVISFLILIMVLFGLNTSVNAFSYNYDNSDNNMVSEIKTIQKQKFKMGLNSSWSYSSSSFYSLQSRATSLSYVYTPRGTQVEVYIRDEMPAYAINICNQNGDTLVPEATRIAPSSSKYNCHSYAWYMQSTSNPYWMNDPSSYYTDWSYEESEGDVGDIICYFDSTGFNLHSGVIIGESEGVSNGICGNSNLYTVRSKWGDWGLYEHRGDQCPYTEPYSGTASYVKFYRVHQHSYTYSPATSGHTATCTDCGYTTTLSHVYDKHYCIHCNAYTTTHDYDMNYEWISYTLHNVECSCGESETTQPHAVASGSYNTGQRFATCLLCGGLAEMGFVQLTINSSAVTNVTINGSFILPNGVIVLEDEDLEAYLNGTLFFYDKDKVPVIQ